MKTYSAIGMMSGTSLDGLDIAFCTFRKESGVWNYRLHKAITIGYSQQWQNRLRNSVHLDAENLCKLDVDFGHYIGSLCQHFIDTNGLDVDLVSSHGHTVFHQPDQGFTLQIGSGAALRSEINVPLVYDFRTQDVALGGQGAPLVPIGDEHLFHEHEACVNIGGFANISLQGKHNKRMAWDICPANFVLNPQANRLGLPYDDKGQLAREGKPDNKLIDVLNALPYYRCAAPKTLGYEWVNEQFIPLIPHADPKDLLATITHHIAHQIATNLPASGQVLITGGGAKNDYLIELIRQQCNSHIIIPEDALVDFKEALIFAFLGVLRVRKEVNVLSSVTGAKKDHCAGSVMI